MEEQIVIGDRVVQVGAYGKPERVVEVRVPGAKRVSRDVAGSELRRIGGLLGSV